MITAIYPGTYDPVTNGHVDVITRAADIFDRVVVGVVGNPQHKQPMFALEERVDFLREALAEVENVEVDVFSELLVDFAKNNGATAVVKGLRAISDFEYEFQMALMNRKLRHTVETVFLMPHEKYTYISSRLIKEVSSFGAAVTGMVPTVVEERLNAKFSRK